MPPGQTNAWLDGDPAKARLARMDYPHRPALCPGAVAVHRITQDCRKAAVAAVDSISRTVRVMLAGDELTACVSLERGTVRSGAARWALPVAATRASSAW